jgi:hypothetical protein
MANELAGMVLAFNPVTERFDDPQFVGSLPAGDDPTFELAITPGTTAQYWRGDKTWQTLNTGAVPEGSNLYFTNARADARITAQKGAANGLATLGSDSKIPTAQLPALAITDTFVVASQAAMLALTAETGDVAVRTDLNKSFILAGTNPATLVHWQELLTPTDAVLSVFGRTGAVTAQSGDYNTSLVTEGSNLYYTAARFNSAFALKTTADLAEGSNLYFTDERVDDRVAALLRQTANQVLLNYDDTAGTLTLSLPQNIHTAATPQFAGLTLTGTLTLSDSNVALGTTTGTKIGTATSQKLGFFNATPVIQPTGTTDLRQALINLGLYASGGASPLDLNGGTLTAANVNAATTSANLFNSTVTTINFGGAATSLNVGNSAGTATFNSGTVSLAGTLLGVGTSYNTDIGQLSKKFKALHAAELWVETLVAQNTLATVGGRILVGTTTSLIADLSTGATTIDVKHNSLASGDRLYMEANGQVEFFAVTSSATTITGGYRYSVTRDLDGTGANQWYAGDAVFNTGTTGSGFIDLYSVSGVKSSSQSGPTITGNVRNSSTYNDWTEHWAVGNLKGLYGYGSTIYGAAFGKYANGSTFVVMDAADGFRVISRAGGSNTVRTQVAADGSAFFGNGNFAVSAAGVLTASGWTLNTTSLNSSTTYFASGLNVPAGQVTWFGQSVAGYQGMFTRDAAGRFVEVIGNNGSIYPYIRVSDGTHNRVVLGGLNNAWESDGSTSSVGMKIWDAAGAKLVEFSDTQNIIASWGVTSAYLAKDTGTNATSAGMAPADYPFYAGATYANRATAPFRVTPAGALVATNATITGTVTATAGTVGGWTLAATSLTSGSGANTVGLDSGGTNPAFYAGSATPGSAPFRVTTAGALTATGATISGAITATSGSFTGTVTATGSGKFVAGGATLDTNGIGLTVGASGYALSSAVNFFNGGTMIGAVYGSYTELPTGTVDVGRVGVTLSANSKSGNNDPSRAATATVAASNNLGRALSLSVNSSNAASGTTTAWASLTPDASVTFQGFVIGASAVVGSALATLDVRGSISATSGWLSLNLGYPVGWNANASTQYIASSYATAINTETNGRLAFYTAPSGTAGATITFTERMTLLTGGNVGIGTNAPAQKLHLYSSTDANGANIRLQVTDTAGNAYLVSGNGTRNWLLGVNGDGTGGANSPFIVYDTTAGALRMVISSAGAFRFPYYGAGTPSFDSSGNLLPASDETLKNIKGDFTLGLAALRKVQPITYEWKHEAAERERLRKLPPEDEGGDNLRVRRPKQNPNPDLYLYHGYGARNVRAAIPGAVGENADGTLTLQDRAISAVHTNAIKELDAGQASLLAKVTELEKQIASLLKKAA